MVEYKFVELSHVTDTDLEQVVNRWVQAGWQFDDIRFVMTAHSKRPAMAFVSFTRALGPEENPTSD
ncbi:MAG: DUF4177 domain-containing protein [Myxococcales bacterium]|nr:DUF4177 domain-containing protein [Myxococcales bacterium]MDD9968643.1 DUF4177 domain-containing protein [Myxococcales bacterium]